MEESRVDHESIDLPDADITLVREARIGEGDGRLLETLIAETPWRSEVIHLFGRTIPQPRLIAWYGDPGTSYTYSGLTLQPTPWTPTLLDIKSRVESLAEHSFNSVLLNYYRDERDSMGLHSDDEPELGERPTIASLSLGEERRFQLKHRHDKERRMVTVLLPPGSLLIMRGETQKMWKHGIPKERSSRGPRVNLTFRSTGRACETLPGPRRER